MRRRKFPSLTVSCIFRKLEMLNTQSLRQPLGGGWQVPTRAKTGQKSLPESCGPHGGLRRARGGASFLSRETTSHNTWKYSILWSWGHGSELGVGRASEASSRRSEAQAVQFLEGQGHHTKESGLRLCQLNRGCLRSPPQVAEALNHSQLQGQDDLLNAVLKELSLWSVPTNHHLHILTWPWTGRCGGSKDSLLGCTRCFAKQSQHLPFISKHLQVQPGKVWPGGHLGTL